MQIHNAISGQYFTLKIIREDGKFTTMILSNVDETRSHVVPIEKRELKELADFIYESIGEKKFAGLRNGKIVEFSNDKLSLNHDHIDQIVEIELNGEKK